MNLLAHLSRPSSRPEAHAAASSHDVAAAPSGSGPVASSPTGSAAGSRARHISDDDFDPRWQRLLRASWRGLRRLDDRLFAHTPEWVELTVLGGGLAGFAMAVAAWIIP